MTENDKDRLPEKNDNPQDKIPLWLQGLQEKPDEPSPTEDPSNTPEKAWVKETNRMEEITPPAGLPNLIPPDEESNENTDEIPTVSGIIGNADEGLPDWLSELSGVNPEIPAIEGSPNEKSPAPETTQPFEDEAEDTDKLQIKTPGLSSEAEYIEISGIDLDNLPDSPLNIDEEALSSEEDPPEWLNEMISTEPTGSPDNEAEFVEDTAPLSSEPSEQEENQVSDTGLEIEIESPQPGIEKSDTNGDESRNESDTSVEEIEIMPLEDTSPVIVHFSEDMNETSVLQQDQDLLPEEDGIPEDLPDDYSDPEEIDSAGVPQTLRFAKVFLDQGEIVRALEILQPYIEKSSHLNEIKGWLTDAALSDTEWSTELWEAIGDIAIYQDDPSEALEAYTKAIKCLLSQKDTHELR